MQGIDANQLKDQKGKILSLWEERCRKEVNSAEGASKLVLRNSLPVYLEHLSEQLATNRRMDRWSVEQRDREAVRIGKLHGSDRASTAGYELFEVIFEYHILREVIFEVLEENGCLSPIQRDIILDSIEQAVNDAAVEFSEIQTSIQQKFVNTLTHDLRTPITSAQMSAQMILRNKSLGALAKPAQQILSSLRRLTSMIDDLLDAGRVRAGQPLALQFENCDLRATLQEVVEEAKAANSNPVSLQAADSSVGVWSTDGIRRAVENLIGNAVKYGAPGGPIDVSLQVGKDQVEIAVVNQGAPIPENEIPHLFDQYRRSKSAEAGAARGWGLGLTLVQGVAKAHGGSVLVESKEGLGTKFTLRLPLERPKLKAS